jgi:ABC-type proline/glycine betaine transport system substrate-binding protein
MASYLVNKENMTPREAARAWMAGHRAMVDEWLAGD